MNKDRKLIIAGNWKMNKTVAEGLDLVRALKTAVGDRDVMPIGKKFSGPAVVTEYSATTVVPPGRSFWLDRAGNLMIAL